MGEMVIRGIRPGQKDITLTFIILEVLRPTKTKEGREVRTAKIADRSGSINLSLWDEIGKLVNSGDIIRMTKGHATIFKNTLTLYTSKNSEFVKTGEFCQVFSEVPFMSEPNSEIVQAAIASAPPGPPGGNGGPQNKPIFRGNNGNSAPGSQQPLPGLPPPAAGGGVGRFPANGEQRAPHPGHGVPGSQPPPIINKWPIHNSSRPVTIKDKNR